MVRRLVRVYSRRGGGAPLQTSHEAAAFARTRGSARKDRRPPPFTSRPSFLTLVERREPPCPSPASFAQTHPRRAEVNGRLANQNARITAGVKDGQLTHGEARAMRADDHAIRAEERADASVNGGHITRAEDRNLNRQENANSRVIHAGRHP